MRIEPAGRSLMIGIVIYALAGLAGSARASDTAQAAGGNTNEAVENEYHKLLLDDNAAENDVLEWLDKAAGSNDRLTMDLKAQQRLEGIKKEYQDFVERHPRHVNARLAFGSFLKDSKDDEGSRTQFEVARELAPTNPSPWNALGNYYRNSGQAAKAFEFYGKAIELDPKQGVYYHNLAATLYLFRHEGCKYFHLDEQEAFEKVLALYRQALKLEPEDFILWSDYAMSFYGVQPPRWKEGLEAWKETLKVAPGEEEREGVDIHLARIYVNLGQYDQARASLDLVTNANFAGLKKDVAEDLKAAVDKGKTNALPGIQGH
jgi:tetratricopeptide (TPR) repeat protein